MQSTLIPAREAAKIIGERTGRPMSPRQMRHEIQMGHLKATKITGCYYIEPDDLEHYQRRHPGRPKKD